MRGAPSTLEPPQPASHLSPLPTYFTRWLPKLDFISVSKGRVYEHVNDNELVQPVVWISPHLDTESTHNQTRPWAPDATTPTGDQDRRRQGSAVWGPTAPRLGPVQGGCPAGSHHLSRGQGRPWAPPPAAQAAGPATQEGGGPGPPTAGGGRGPAGLPQWSSRAPRSWRRAWAGRTAHSGADVPYKLIFPGLRLKEKTFSVPTRFKASIS